jgi:hypothetical protein
MTQMEVLLPAFFAKDCWLAGSNPSALDNVLPDLAGAICGIPRGAVLLLLLSIL